MHLIFLGSLLRRIITWSDSLIDPRYWAICIFLPSAQPLGWLSHAKKAGHEVGRGGGGGVNDTLLREIYFKLRFCFEQSFAILLIDAGMSFSIF